jgi:hypothetical protein
VAKKKKVVASAVLLDLPVKFGSVSIGMKTGKVGFSIDRGNITLKQADETFVDRRLTGKIVLGRSADAKAQKMFIPDRDIEVNASFDVKGFRVGATMLSSLGLTFMLKEVNLDDISHMSGGSGRLVIAKVGNIPADAPKEDLGDEEERPMLAEGPWADVPLAELWPKGGPVLKNLKAAKVHTVGDLAALTAKGEFWAKDTKGIGPSARQIIEDRLEKFWKDNPQYATK